MIGENKKNIKPLIFLILDGWGIGKDYEGSMMSMANIRIINDLISRYPATILEASGNAIGLSDGQAGNSILGHTVLGLGRVIDSNLNRVDKAIQSGDFYRNEVLLRSIENAKKNNSKLNLIGLLSDGGINSSFNHLESLLKLLKESKLKEVYLHAILDGVDTHENSSVKYIEEIEEMFRRHGLGTLASASGRFFAMDRGGNWERTRKSYLAITQGEGKMTEDIIGEIKKSRKKKINDNEIAPIVISRKNKPTVIIEDNDSVIFFNIEASYIRQLAKMFSLPSYKKDTDIQKFKNLDIVTLVEYEKELPVNVAFPMKSYKKSLVEVLNSKGIKQLYLSDVNRYAHFESFFTGQQDSFLKTEDYIVLSGAKIIRSMSQELIKKIRSREYDFLAINISEPEIYSKTGDLAGLKKTIEVADKFIGKIVREVLDSGSNMIISSSHGNLERMVDLSGGEIDFSNTKNPVPFVLVGNEYEGKNIGFKEAPGNDLSLIKPVGSLMDVAPTILSLLSIKKPKEMMGESLIQV